MFKRTKKINLKKNKETYNQYENIDHPTLTREQIYNITTKPTEYVNLNKPKNKLSPQDYRQLQYNRWCETLGVYNGAYMPKDCDTLLKKGWIEITHPECIRKTNGKHRFFKRNSTNQHVEFDAAEENHKKIKPKHYHWLNLNHKKDNIKNYNVYGIKDKQKDSPEVHIAPLNEKYKEIKKDKYNL